MSATRPIIVIPGDDPIQIAGSPHLDRLRRQGEVVIYHEQPTSPEEKIARAQDATALLNSRGSTTWPSELLRKLPKLKMITTCSIGTDSIDLETARELGIVVSNVPKKTATVVAEHASCLMLAATRRVAFHTHEI